MLRKSEVEKGTAKLKKNKKYASIKDKLEYIKICFTVPSLKQKIVYHIFLLGGSFYYLKNLAHNILVGGVQLKFIKVSQQNLYIWWKVIPVWRVTKSLITYF